MFLQSPLKVTFHPLSDICNSYVMGTSALPDIYACARGPRASAYIQAKHKCPWYNMFYISMQTYLIGKSLVVIPFSYIGNQVSCDCGIEF